MEHAAWSRAIHGSYGLMDTHETAGLGRKPLTNGDQDVLPRGGTSVLDANPAEGGRGITVEIRGHTRSCPASQLGLAVLHQF